MADNRDYFIQQMENGSIQISDDVAASVAASAVLEVDGVYGLSGNIGTDIAEMLGRKTLAKGIRLSAEDDNSISVECNIVASFGASVLQLAESVQKSVKTSVESVTGLSVRQVNVNINAIAMPREQKK